MTEKGAVFLSASVPMEGRMGYDKFDPVLIAAAVHAFVEVVLGRRLLVWGGQPAITPIIWEASRRLGVSYVDSVKLYQSAFFRGRYPKVNVKFENWVEVPAVEGNQDASLARMRSQMFGENEFQAAVFIGGMEGVIKEFNDLRESSPDTLLIPIPAPGGVSRHLFNDVEGLPKSMLSRTDFTYWLYTLLNIDPSEPRVLSWG